MNIYIYDISCFVSKIRNIKCYCAQQVDIIDANIHAQVRYWQNLTKSASLNAIRCAYPVH